MSFQFSTQLRHVEHLTCKPWYLDPRKAIDLHSRRWKLDTNKKNSWKSYIAKLFVLGSILGSLAVTTLLTIISRQNYPGGEALVTANHLLGKNSKSSVLSNFHLTNSLVANVHIHMANLAAQSGASLFLQEHAPPYLSTSMVPQDRGRWTYDKTENLNSLQEYTHAIVEDLAMVDGWKVNSTILSFERVTKSGITYSPKLWIVSNPLQPWIESD